MKAKVFTGRWMTDPEIESMICEGCRAAHHNGWRYISIDSEMHPSEIVEAVDRKIGLAASNEPIPGVYFQTNNDHVFNRLRTLRKRGVLESVEFIHFRANEFGSVERHEITVDKDGECSEYPPGFLDGWKHQIGGLSIEAD